MFMQLFSVHPHNIHYEGEYSDTEIEWRRVCALDKASNIKTLLGLRNVATVLEVGCGTGAVLAAVAKLGIGSRHVGVDMADPQLHLDNDAKGLDILQYDGDRLPFADKSFDLVFASHVIEHVPNPRALLGEMRRVARHFVYAEVPCELHVRADRNSLQRTLDIGHINAYTPESFVLLIQSSELEIYNAQIFDHSLEVQGFRIHKYSASLKKLIRSSLLRISPRWASRIFTYHCSVLCGPVNLK